MVPCVLPCVICGNYKKLERVYSALTGEVKPGYSAGDITTERPNKSKTKVFKQGHKSREKKKTV